MSDSPQDRSRSRGREFTSTGRGGAGNIIRSDSATGSPREASREPARGREVLSTVDHVTHSGRGGAGNIRSPSRDPVEDAKVLEREHIIIEERRRKEGDQVYSSGRGGAGNIINADRSRSRSRDPAVHSSGRGGAGNIVTGRVDASELERLEEEERGKVVHPQGIHSTGRGGAGNLTSASAEPEVLSDLHHDGEYTSSGRGGAGNIHHNDAAFHEDSRGRADHKPHGIGGFIERLTSRSRAREESKQ